jgi:uncharacterized protein with PIN domain
LRFATDVTVGKLGRYLRLAGFDTLCQHESPDGDFFNKLGLERVILTRSSQLGLRLKSHPLVLIRDNDPPKQLMQVVRTLNLKACDANPFSRCLVCNRVVQQISREAVTGRVPAYVWQRHHTFHACGKCGRIYWPGSHHDRMRKRLAAIFRGSRQPFVP